MRIKLNFADVLCYSELSLSNSWFLLDPDDVKTVADLAKELIQKFRLKCDSGSLQLTLDDCLLPDWESTRILRDSDTVRVHLVQNSCQSKHKKRKRHLNNDNCEHASWNSAAEPATHDVEISSVITDNSQNCHVVVEKKKKLKSHFYSDGHSVKNQHGSEVSSRQTEEEIGRNCKEATNDCWFTSSQNLETFPSAQNGTDDDTAYRHAVPSDSVEVQTTGNLEHLGQPQTALSTVTSVKDSSMTTSSSPADIQLNGGSSVCNEEQLKLSHSATRRRRRHRNRKNAHRKDDGDMPNDEQSKNILAADASLLQNVSGSNLPTHTGHSSEFGRTHIIFDNRNSDDENNVKAEPTTHPTCDKYDGGTFRDDPVSGCDTVFADSTVNNSSGVETPSHLQHENGMSNGIVCSEVKKQFSANHLPNGRKVYHPAKHSPFANVQVYCRQRVKKSASATCMPHSQAVDTVAIPLPKVDNAHLQAPAVKDYSQYCSLQGTPRPGDVIAYKMVEMTDDYTPAMSQHKEATVTEFNPLTNVVVLQAAADGSRKRTPGRFDISIEYEDEILTNVCQNSKTRVQWTALHDVRLLKER